MRQGHLSSRLANITDLALKSKQRFRKLNKFKWNGELFCDGIEVEVLDVDPRKLVVAKYQLPGRINVALGKKAIQYLYTSPK